MSVCQYINVNVVYSILYIPLKESRFKSGTQANTDKVSYCAYLVHTSDLVHCVEKILAFHKLLFWSQERFEGLSIESRLFWESVFIIREMEK